MRCVKCDGVSVFPAMNEAPDGARDWRRCLSCGTRWDPTTTAALDTIKRAFEEWQPDEGSDGLGGEGGFDAEDRRLARDHADAFEDTDAFGEVPPDEPVVTASELAMKDVLVKRGRKKKEAAVAIGGRCTQRGCDEDAAADSVKCPHHRDVQQVKNARYQGRPIPTHLAHLATGEEQQETAAKKPGRPRTPSSELVTVPATCEPETLPTPHLVQQTGHVVSLLDAVITETHADLAALERVRAILSRPSIACEKFMGPSRS